MSEGIGVRLRGARERNRLTILQAAEKLHLDPDILEALEAEHFAALGAPVYVKGHLRHYAELVGESAQALFDLYSQGDRVPQPDLTRIPKAEPDDTGRLAAPAVLVVIGFAIAGTVWWGFSLSHRHASLAGSHAVPATVHAAAPIGREAPVKLTLLGAAAAPVRAAEPVPSTAAPPATPVSNTLPGARAVSSPHGEIDAVFTFSGESWTEVHDATGKRLLYGLFKGPATRKLEGVPPLTVTLGNATGVTIEVGGRNASISRFERSDHTARFLIAADGRVLAAPAKKGD